MPLVTCADCGREISSLAPACIHCGRPTPHVAAAPPPAAAPATPQCPFCTAAVTHLNARTGGIAWCERCGAQLSYGVDGTLLRALPRAPEPPRPQPQPQPQFQPPPQPQPVYPVVIVRDRKSVGGAMLLALFFGPLGMLYSTGLGAFIMFLMYAWAAVFTLGAGFFVLWPVCILWAGYAASEYNRRLGPGVGVLM